MKVSVIGAGHVGLPTAAVLAHLGHEVRVTDSDETKIAALSRDETPFYEPELDDLVRAETASGRLSFHREPRPALEDAELAFICVGTPPRAHGDASLIAVERAAESVGRYATRPMVVVEKSTVPAGTADRISQTLARYNPDLDFLVASNPEFLREGSAIADSLRPSRILVGSDSVDAFATMRRLYAPLIERGVPLIETDIRTAELAKHASNAFLALKISFINAIARVSDLCGADVTAVAEVMGADERIGRGFLDAGLGYGGYCFPKDLVAFERLSQRFGYDFPLLKEIARINDEAVQACLRKIEESLWNLEGKKIALLGVAYKPGTDDVRFSPALALARELIAAGARVHAYDPLVPPAAAADVAGLRLEASADASLRGAHCAVVCTAWREFRDLDLARVKSWMSFPVIVDARNFLDGAGAAREGFTYIGTGVPTLKPGSERRPAT